MSSATDDLASAAQALTEAMRATAADPVDAIRILGGLLATPLPVLVDPLAREAQAATAAMFRRAALASIAMACADYQPTSSTEADAAVVQVSGWLSAEATTAADAGEDAAYAALRELQTAVVADLRARSATLPELVTVALPGHLPSLAMAYRLYGDTTREPDLVARAQVRHPGFMPDRFEALAL